ARGDRPQGAVLHYAFSGECSVRRGDCGALACAHGPQPAGTLVTEGRVRQRRTRPSAPGRPGSFCGRPALQGVRPRSVFAYLGRAPLVVVRQDLLVGATALRHADRAGLGHADAVSPAAAIRLPADDAAALLPWLDEEERAAQRGQRTVRVEVRQT